MTDTFTPPQARALIGRALRKRNEDRLAVKIADSGLPAPQREYRFHPPRRWRFDFAWPKYCLAVEVDGGVYSAGRHTRGAGYEKDCEKGNAAVVDGWRVLHFTPTHITGDYAVQTIAAALWPT